MSRYPADKASTRRACTLPGPSIPLRQGIAPWLPLMTVQCFHWLQVCKAPSCLLLSLHHSWLDMSPLHTAHACARIIKVGCFEGCKNLDLCVQGY